MCKLKVVAFTCRNKAMHKRILCQATGYANMATSSFRNFISLLCYTSVPILFCNIFNKKKKKKKKRKEKSIMIKEFSRATWDRRMFKKHQKEGKVFRTYLSTLYTKQRSIIKEKSQG